MDLPHFKIGLRQNNSEEVTSRRDKDISNIILASQNMPRVSCGDDYQIPDHCAQSQIGNGSKKDIAFR